MVCCFVVRQIDLTSRPVWLKKNIKWIEDNGGQWACCLSGMTEMFCDFCGHADSDCERLQEGSDRTLCRDSKSVLDRINQSDCMGLRLILTVETKTTQPARGWGGTGRSKSSVITLHPLIIQWDRDSCAWHAHPTCTLKRVWAHTCRHRCEHLDLLTCELCELFTLCSPAKWHLKIPTGNWVNQSWHWTVTKVQNGYSRLSVTHLSCLLMALFLSQSFWQLCILLYDRKYIKIILFWKNTSTLLHTF